jgi:hypothetical protein
MYHEELGKITSEHLREHIVPYLAELEVRYGDGVKLSNPKAIEYANLVGGVYNTGLDEMPAYAVDVTQKRFSAISNNNLWEYAYDGHIAGVVTGGSEKEVNTLVKRHEQAVEMFIKRHGNMHGTEAQVVGNDFKIIELGFVDADYSGAELVQERTSQKKRWLAGFRITLIWIVSEDGPHQHA